MENMAKYNKKIVERITSMIRRDSFTVVEIYTPWSWDNFHLVCFFLGGGENIDYSITAATKNLETLGFGW